MAEAQPLVSVIMPFYNTAPVFMVEAVQSVRAQTYGHWELLLVDDGSTLAESSETARRFAAGDPQRIRYLEHPGRGNHGPGPSRQLALQQVQGELIAFLDADDVWLPQKLEEQVKLMCAYPEVGALYGRTMYWYSWTGAAQDAAKDAMPPLGLPDGAILEPPALLTLFVAQQVAIPCPCSIMIRQTVVEASGGFDVHYKGYYDDQMLYAKVCLRTPVLVTEACWDYYRQHPKSGTHQLANQAQQLHLIYLRWLSDYLAQQGVQDDNLWQTLRRQLWLYGQPQWLPQALHQPARMGKKWLLRLRWPYARILLAAACLLIVYSTVAEAALRVLPVHQIFGAPNLGSEHRQFEHQWFRLHNFVAEHGPVGCIMIGDSTVMSDFSPADFETAHKQQSGQEIACYNFGVGAFSLEGLAVLSELLVREYSPRLLLVGVEALNFTVPHDQQGESDLAAVPWARYQLGEFAPEGWLYENSQFYRYIGVVGELLTFKLDLRELLQRTADEQSIGADGYSALSGAGPFDVAQPPDPAVDHPYIEHYFAAMSPFRLLPENQAALDRILKMSGSMTQVVLVEMPVTGTFHAFFGNYERDYQQFISTVRTHAATEEVPFLRMAGAGALPAHLWYNFNHLNSEGAPLFSHWLGARLATMSVREN